MGRGKAYLGCINIMVENTFAQFVIERMGVTEAELSKPRIISFLPLGLYTLAQRVANNTIDRISTREELRKDFSVVVTSGVGALSTHLSAAEPILIEYARGWVVTSAVDLTLGRPMAYSYLADKASFQNDHPLGVGYFTVDGTSLLVITSLGVRTPSVTYTVHSAYVSTLASLPVSLEDDIVSITTALIQNGGVVLPEPAMAAEV